MTRADRDTRPRAPVPVPERPLARPDRVPNHDGVVALLLVALAFATAACTACGDTADASPAASDASVHDSTPDSDAALETGKPDADAAPDVPAEAAPDAPPAVPPGWEAWTGWSEQCPLYIPGEHGEMPPAIEWEPCEEPLPQDIDCRQMKHFWREEALAISLFPRMDTTGAVPLLAFSRLYVGGDANIAYRLIAEPDGQIRTAFYQANAADKECGIAEDGLNEGRYIYFTLTGTHDEPVEGFLAGAVVAGPPSVVYSAQGDPSLLSAWSLSKDWIVQRRAERTAWTWDLKTQHTAYTAANDPDTLRGFNVTVIGKDVLVEVGDLLPHGVMTWNLDQGLRPLIRWYGDSSKGAGNFGTDGKDMVWTYAEGPLGNNTYEKLDVMTASFTTDAGQVQARRLRSDVKGFDPWPWVVGCGWAARGVSLLPPINNAQLIVRLTDGVSWLLPGKLDLPNAHWSRPLGFTCEEMFTTVTGDDTFRIVRIRLDSLGPGTPAD